MIGLLPAAGRAKRFEGHPKWMLPVPEGNLIAMHAARMREAGARITLIGAGYHNASDMYKYAPTNTETYTVESKTMSETVLAAQQLTHGDNVLFGMPDTYWKAPDVYQRLAQMICNGVEVAVAVWRVRDEQRGEVGQVALNPIGRVIQVVDKEPACVHPWLWGALAWSPKFWQYIKPEHPHVGYALQAAIEAGLLLASVQVEGGYHDCGTNVNYWRLCSQFVTESLVIHG